MTFKAANTRRDGNVHEAYHLHRRSAHAAQAARAEGVLRLRRSRFLCRGDAARQSRGPAANKTAPAHPGRCLQARHVDQHPGRALRPAPDPGAGRPARHAAWRRRDSCLPRGAGRGHSFHPEHDVDLLDRGYRSGRRQAVLVPALRDEGPRLHQGADRARHRGEMLGAGAHRRPAGDRPAPPGHQERHDRAAGMVAVETDRFRDQARLGRGRAAAASAAPSAISRAI